MTLIDQTPRKGLVKKNSVIELIGLDFASIIEKLLAPVTEL